MDKNNVTVLQGAGIPNLSKDSIRRIRADFPILLELIKTNAELTRAKFDALKNQGFTNAEAVELSKQLF